MIGVNKTEAVAELMLNRPEARNALSRQLIAALSRELDRFEAAPDTRAIVVTGKPVFCAGADIAEMSGITVLQALAEDFSGCCERLARCTKPVIAAVEGYAIGGGCELIEMCDIVVAAEDARFGHPEITLGTLSGAGGTQRLARAVGRAKAMDLVLTGRLIGAAEAERIGLVSRVVPAGAARAAALDIARDLARQPPLAVRLAKEAVDRAVGFGLEDGLRLERRLFHLTFATGEFHRGMDDFLQRRAGRG
ncbi:MAG: enoyl-CoA hydratase-related protein [Xanthobacteraceae bacterium]|nr:enoyl-CoA hydratase-related protein [Xanthobacteraceae bacterium]